jgi:hypothetical protein
MQRSHAYASHECAAQTRWQPHAPALRRRPARGPSPPAHAAAWTCRSRWVLRGRQRRRQRRRRERQNLRGGLRGMRRRRANNRHLHRLLQRKVQRVELHTLAVVALAHVRALRHSRMRQRQRVTPCARASTATRVPRTHSSGCSRLARSAGLGGGHVGGASCACGRAGAFAARHTSNARFSHATAHQRRHRPRTSCHVQRVQPAAATRSGSGVALQRP